MLEKRAGRPEGMRTPHNRATRGLAPDCHPIPNPGRYVNFVGERVDWHRVESKEGVPCSSDFLNAVKASMNGGVRRGSGFAGARPMAHDQVGVISEYMFAICTFRVEVVPRHV